MALPGVFFWKFPLPLHVEHQISTVHVLNDKKESVIEKNG